MTDRSVPYSPAILAYVVAFALLASAGGFAVFYYAVADLFGGIDSDVIMILVAVGVVAFVVIAAVVAIGRGLARGRRSSWRAALLVVLVFVPLHVAFALAPSSAADSWYALWLGPIPLYMTWAVVLWIHRHRYRDKGDASG